ncbi:hypothetical protein FDP41_004020 [Naegleria fowleri]|uniref:Uncharacterized protein n=1 Tax=Naegleria fowleri TaxID=5763 RepID=A0A6A5BTJ5_NAEFO|nr:uncharacterized protein FDP41_004020 [Naegleria fowleri]KAF0976725.1 hypothetical protein FDP41_004020 [Naegleria fowleri]
MSLDDCGSVVTSIDIEEDESIQTRNPLLDFVSEKFYKRVGDANLSFIPLKLRNDGTWFTIANYELFHTPCQNDKILLHSIVWSQRSFFQYCFYFYPEIYMEGSFFKGESAMNKLFLSSSRSVTLSDEEIALQPENDNFGRIRKTCQKLKKIETSEKFILRYLDDQFFHNPEIETIQNPVPEAIDYAFNHQIERFLFNIWSNGFLQTKAIQNYVFRLFIHLDAPRFDFHTIKFHDTAASSCPNKEAILGVEAWIEDYLTNQTPENSETFYTFVEEKGKLSGYSCGQSDHSYVY